MKIAILDIQNRVSCAFSFLKLLLLQYVVTFKQANAYAHPQARARRRAQPLKITIHQLLHCITSCGNVIEFHSVLLLPTSQPSEDERLVRRQHYIYVVRTSVTHSAAPRVPLFCSYHILTSSVIYY